MWFWAAYLMTTDKRGIPALLLQRQLGLRRYETAWMLLHKLRRAMVDAAREPLYGEVETGGLSRIDSWIGTSASGEVTIRNFTAGRSIEEPVRSPQARRRDALPIAGGWPGGADHCTLNEGPARSTASPGGSAERNPSSRSMSEIWPEFAWIEVENDADPPTKAHEP